MLESNLPQVPLKEALTPGVDVTVEALLRNPRQSNRRSDGLTDEEFESLVDELATMQSDLPPLSDYGVSRESIYEGHPYTRPSNASRNA